jgi:D-hydroxyproline dehydrogenase subunit gamma
MAGPGSTSGTFGGSGLWNEGGAAVGGLRVSEGVARNEAFEFRFDGQHIQAHAGETIATALLAAGNMILNRSQKHSHPRGVFCGIGLCYGCLVTVNGMPNIRACQTDASPGMVVESQHGNGKLRFEE